jgi:hypothetical protein
LLYLSGSDIVVLWSGTAIDANESINGILIKDTSSFMCKMSRFITLASAGFSAWLLVLMTFERIFLSMTHKVAYPKMTPRFAFIASTVLLFIIVLFTCHLIFGFYFDEVNIPTEKNASQFVKVKQCLFMSTDYMIFYNEIWKPLVLLFLNVIPVIAITCGNIIIGLQILQYRNMLRRIFPVPTTASRARQRKTPAKMLFLVSGIFLVTTLPYTIYLVVKNELRDLDERSIARHQLLTSALSMLLYSNFTFNFFLYFVSGTLFKLEWQTIIKEIIEKRINMLCFKKQPRTDIIRLQNLR